MPKIRCKRCETVLNIPEQARGKVVACTKCGTKFRVPGGPGASSRPPAGATPKKKSATAADGVNVFARLDLKSVGMDDAANAICPYCAAPLDPEDPVCRGCGMNVATGKMDAKEKKRRSIKGPDPALFFKKVWGEAWSFTMQEKRLVFRTGTFWLLFSVLHALCAYMGLIYSSRIPPKVFWTSLTILCWLGIPGWFLFLGLKVIQSTVLREQFRSDRIQFDFFLTIAAGLRTIFWPLIVMGPFTPTAILFFAILGGAFGSSGVLISGAILWVGIPILLLPIALVHMTARYTYKGWILWELLKIFVKNVLATIYCLFIAVVAFLPVAAVAIPILWAIGTVNPFVSEPVTQLTAKITLWIMKIADLGTSDESFWYTVIIAPLNILATTIIFAPICYLAGFPALFMMRVFGLFGYYNNHSLDLVQQMAVNTKATFWVRYLAHTVDGLFIPLTSFLVTANAKVFMVGWFINAVVILIWWFQPHLLWLAVLIWPLYTSWMYWAVQESSQLRSTLGKDGFGLIVITDKGKNLTLKQATGKWFLRLIFDVIPIVYLTSAFRSDKKAPHDMITKTQVVWAGDK